MDNEIIGKIRITQNELMMLEAALRLYIEEMGNSIVDFSEEVKDYEALHGKLEFVTSRMMDGGGSC